MAIIRRRECDICGNPFKFYEDKGNHSFFHIRCFVVKLLFRIDLCPDCIGKLKKVKSFNDSVQKAYDQVVEEAFKKGYTDANLSIYLDGVCKLYDRIIQLGVK